MEDKCLLDVSGMTCSSCAQGISRHLEKRGLKNVLVSYERGEVELGLTEGIDSDQVIREINSLGYKASIKNKAEPKTKRSNFPDSLEIKFIVSAALTLPLTARMFFHHSPFSQPLIQFLLCLPVMYIGWMHFGRSAWGALRSGTSNMDVLISTGSLAAFAYSCYGWYAYANSPEIDSYLFFETSSTIISLLLLGNIIEKRSLKKTQSSLEHLTKIQPVIALKIIRAMTATESTEEVNASLLKPNDLVLINTGQKVPADGLIYEGEAIIDSSMMTGESLPQRKAVNDNIMSGTIILEGSVKIIVKNSGEETILSKMIETVRRSATRKPRIQKAGDKISAGFVPLVIVLSLITFLVSTIFLDLSIREALLRAIAILVISCPCAMGLATPTAVAVGIGKAARRGILIKGGDTLEKLAGVKSVVFDKTGTLTTGKIILKAAEYKSEKALADYLVATLEKHSTHPYATALSNAFSGSEIQEPIRFREIKEIKGAGVMASGLDGKSYKIGSARFTEIQDVSGNYQVFLTCDGNLLASFRLEDHIREDSAEVIRYFQEKNIKTILLSGDNIGTAKSIGKSLGIQEIYGEKNPDEKSEIIRRLQQSGPVAMVGDGINDAAALSLADVGIAMGSGTQVAIQTAEMVLIGSDNINGLSAAHQLAGKTLKTIRQNLIWALMYNVIAIPTAAFGMLSPMLASLSMAFSDVIVIGNSLRLHLTRQPHRP